MLNDSFVATSAKNQLKSNHLRSIRARAMARLKGLIPSMSDEQNNEEFPDDGYIFMNWLTTEQAAEIMGMSTRAALYLCKEEKIRAKKFGGKYRGEWRIDPESAKNYERRKPSSGNDNDDDV